jgi:creatinine amidohydrolase
MIHGFIPPSRFFPYLTWQEIATMPNRDQVVIIQPLGAIEQHGYHLPLIVDSAISQGVLGEALKLLSPQIPAYALPTLYYGKSNEHDGFPGTISLSASTLFSLLTEVSQSIYQAGFRKLILMNSHGGQPQIMEIIARDLHQQYPDLAIFPFFTWRVPNITNELLTPTEQELGIHAGDAETSLILSLLPEQVKMDLAVREYPRNLAPNSLLSLEGKLPFAWLTKELSHSGVMGDGTNATKEKGDRILASLAQGWVRVIQDVYQFKL